MMGRNLISCCHKCQEQCYHFRGEEQETILPFYKAHSQCMRINPANVETLDDQLQEQGWMRDEGGYTEWLKIAQRKLTKEEIEYGKSLEPLAREVLGLPAETTSQTELS